MDSSEIPVRDEQEAGTGANRQPPQTDAERAAVAEMLLASLPMVDGYAEAARTRDLVHVWRKGLDGTVTPARATELGLWARDVGLLAWR